MKINKNRIIQLRNTALIIGLLLLVVILVVVVLEKEARHSTARTYTAPVAYQMRTPLEKKGIEANL